MKKVHNIISQSKEKVYLHCKGGYDRTGVAVATYFIYQGKTPEEAQKLFRKVSKPVKDRYVHSPLIETDWDVLERYRDWLSEQHKPCTNLHEEIKSDGYVVATLEAAIWCLLNTDNYKDCVLKAVNLGGDTDTTAAVAGGLAGMYYGVDSIPKEWLTQLVKRDYIEELCEKFLRSMNQWDNETEPQS